MPIRLQAETVMRRLTTALMAVMLVASALAAVPAVTMAQETDTATPDGETATDTATPQVDDTAENDTDDNRTDPGARLAGVIGVGEAELDGELQSRTFGIRVAQTASDGAKADVVADQLNDSEQRLEELQERRATLQEARENGSMSEGEYRAQIARLHTETRNVQRLTNETNETASGLPAETLEERGINATRIGMLSERASELSGTEVAAIARGIAGENAGEQARPDQARDRGDRDGEERPDGNGNASDPDGQNGEADAPDGEGNTSDPGGQDDGADAPDSGGDDAPADDDDDSSAGSGGSGSGDGASDSDGSSGGDGSDSGAYQIAASENTGGR